MAIVWWAISGHGLHWPDFYKLRELYLVRLHSACVLRIELILFDTILPLRDAIWEREKKRIKRLCWKREK